MSSNAFFQQAKSFVKSYPPLYRAAVLVRRWLWLWWAQTVRWALPNYLALRRATRRVQRQGANRIGAAAAKFERRHVVMLAVCDLHRDPRVEREARALAQAGYEVTVICPKAWIGDLDINWGREIKFTILPQRQSFYVFPFLYDKAMYEAAASSGAWAFHCHDLNTSVVGLAAATETGAHCVCDFHEWYSENVSWNDNQGKFLPHPEHVASLYRSAERLVLQHASAVITVSGSIADAIRDSLAMSRTVEVIRNIPEFQAPQRTQSTLRDRLSLDHDIFIVLYQGGVGPSRHLEPVMEAIRYARNAVLIIRGPGVEEARAEYEQFARRLGISDRIFFLPPVPRDRVVAEAASADAGVWTLADLCANFRLALPNKVFEYIAAGIPLLVAGHPEVRKLVDDFEIGICFDPDDPKDIASAIDRLHSDRALYERCKQNLRRAMAAFDPQEELRKLVSIYNSLPSGNETRPSFNTRAARGA